MKTRQVTQQKSVRNRFLMLPALAASLLLGGIGGASAEDKPAPKPASLTSLIVETPEDGFALAIKLSQKAVGATQKDVEVRKSLRPIYANDPNSLIAVSHVVATTSRPSPRRTITGASERLKQALPAYCSAV